MTDALVDEWLERLRPNLDRWYEGAGPCHDLSHAVRVALLAGCIARAESTPVEPAILCGLLHDAGHAAAIREGTDDHEIRSGQIVRDLPDDVLEARWRDVVASAIEGRRFAKRGHSRSATAAILDDADNLDAIGLVGASRAFLFIGERGWPEDDASRARDLSAINARSLRRHWDEKLSLLAGEMRTATARRMALPRHEALERLIAALEIEIDSSSEAGAEVPAHA